MSAEITSFVNELLRTEPGAPNTIQLHIDVDDDPCALFEVLLLVMTEILKKWYPPPITISAVSEANLARLIGYFASFGIKFSLDVSDVPRVLRINNRDYTQKSRLEDMKFQVSAEDKLYTVRFSNLPAM